MLALETFGFDVPSTVQLEEELSLMINHFNVSVVRTFGTTRGVDQRSVGLVSD